MAKSDLPPVPAPSKPIAEMNDDELREYRRKVLDLLTDVPNPDADKSKQRPGALVGEGPIKDKVSYTKQWFEDVEARRKDRDENGNLVWPDYGIIWFDATEDEVIRVNGVGYQVFSGKRCGLPAPHYAVYREKLQAPQKLKEKYDPPASPGREAGYVSPVHRMGTGFFHTAEQAAAADKNS